MKWRHERKGPSTMLVAGDGQWGLRSMAGGLALVKFFIERRWRASDGRGD